MMSGQFHQWDPTHNCTLDIRLCFRPALLGTFFGKLGSPTNIMKELCVRSFPKAEMMLTDGQAAPVWEIKGKKIDTP